MLTQAEIEEAVPTLLNHMNHSLQQMNKNEDDQLLQVIEKIEHNLSSVKTLDKHQLVQKFKQLASNRNDIHSILNNFDLAIEKINQILFESQPQQKAKTEKLNKTLSDSQQQEQTFPSQSTSKESPQLSKSDLKILRDPVLKNFQVSYDYLQKSHLKFCLVFLSIFPENAVIRKRALIYWWIGEGLISNEGKGEEILEELLKLELIIPFGNGKNPVVKECTIHPWIRYLLISLAENAGLLHVDARGLPRFNIESSRRACLLADDEKFSQNGSNDSGPKNDLRTIFNVNQRYVSFRSKWLANQEKLVVLQLGRWHDKSTHHIEVTNEEWLKDLRTQKHLKYLSLRGISRITALPNFIVELISLEMLDLKACHNLETLPDDISPLKKLTHLDVSEGYLLESMPKGLDKLTSLEVLKGFVIGNSKKTPCRIHDLGNLNKLKRLSIHIGSEAVIQEGEFQKLKDIVSVRRLKISWGKVVEESFSFPPYLEKLDLEGLPYKNLPEWLRPNQLKELKKLYIKGGKLETLGHRDKEGTWEVTILRLHHLKYLKYEMEDLKNLFPSMRYVQVIDENEAKEQAYP